MTERPILFSAPMVRAILEGKKTQTRRVLKHQPIRCNELPVLLFPQSRDEAIEQTGYIWPNAKEQILSMCPYGKPDDRLWVRETHAPQPDCWGAWSNWNIGDKKGPKPIIHYRADNGQPWVDAWRPSIHMPRWASRINLEITGVRVERLNDISEADAIAEGVKTVRVSETDYRYIDYLRVRKIEEKAATVATAVVSYATLWESINGPGSWDANPWVWAVEFKRVQS